MIPTRSPPKLLIICVINCLDLSIRFGAISSANILLETSKAKTTSTPSRVTVSIFVPILGFTKAITKLVIANNSIINLNQDLKKDRSGVILFKAIS